MKTERKKKKTHIFNDEPRQTAEDIFGVNFDYGEFEQYDEDDLEEDYEEDEEIDLDEVALARKKKRKRAYKTILDEYEPSELERRHYTDKDNEIRNTDIPERMQLRNFPITAPGKMNM